MSSTTLKKTERFVSEIRAGKNAKAQRTLESIIKSKLEKRIREIEEKEESSN